MRKLGRWVLVFAACAACAYGQNDWPVFGHDPGGTRYSPLKQINTSNVARLERAWTFHSGKPGSETTPVVVGGVMYVTAPTASMRWNRRPARRSGATRHPG